MEKVTITIKTENAAFQDGFLVIELARILKEIISDLENNETMRSSYMDINGNSVCEVKTK